MYRLKVTSIEKQFIREWVNSSEFFPNSLTHMHTTYTRHAHMLIQYSYPFIKSPIFVLNSQYDTWQLANILQLGCLPPRCSEQR